MKLSLLLLPALVFVVGCDNDDDNGFPKHVDIEFKIKASDNKRMTEVETVIYGPNLDLRTRSFSNNHLPYNKLYINQEIPELSAVEVSFRDYSDVPIGAVFKPYTVEMLVEIDGDTAIYEQRTVDKQSYVVTKNLSLTEYFANR